MDSIDKEIISLLYIESILQESPDTESSTNNGGGKVDSDSKCLESIRNKLRLDSETFENRLKFLVDNGLIEKDRVALTEIGRTSIKVVLTGGVFDIIHPGHIHTLQSAKKLGDVLVVVIATDNTASKMKGRAPLHDMELRKSLVNSLKMVDYGILGYEGNIFETVKFVKPEIIALGYDQIHQEKFIRDGCNKIGVKVEIARLQSPIPDIKSSKIENEYGESIYRI